MTSTRDTIICMSNKENKFLIQDLKNHDVEFKVKDKNAKGAKRAKTLIIIYLRPKEKARLILPYASILHRYRMNQLR